MRNFNSAFTSLRTALLCASAALLFVACGNDEDKEQNPNPGNSTQSTGTAGTDSNNTGSGGEATKKQLGEACTAAAECVSNICREFSADDPTNPGTKVTVKTCSACNADADCTDPAKGNLCVPSITALDLQTIHFACGKGELGGGCLDNSNCSDGRLCGPILGTQITTCGECVTNEDCKDPAKPSCSVKREGDSAYRACGTKLADGQPCSGEEGSDDECENYCAKLELTDVPLNVGVCSPCKEDSHCAEGQSCKPPSIGSSGTELLPAKCEAKEAESTTTGEATTTGTETMTDTSSTSTDSTT